MRWLRLYCLVFALAACARPALAIAAGPADGPGCLGVTVEECVRWLRATMKLDESFLAAAMARRHQTDVNGRSLGGGLVTVNGQLPGRVEPFVILLHLRPDDTVKSVESNLLLDLTGAHTEEVYDQSALYDIVSRLLGRRCAGMTRIDLYRFFENTVKPQIRQELQDVAGPLSSRRQVLAHAAGVPLCGDTFSYTNLVERRGSAGSRAGRGVKSFSSIELR